MDKRGMDAVLDELVNALQESGEYANFKQARDAAFQNPLIFATYKEYRRLAFQAQADEAAGRKDDDLIKKLQLASETLQFDEDAMQFLLAEYRINQLLTDIFKRLAKAVDADIGILE